MKAYRVQKVTPAGEVIDEHEIRASSAEEAVASVVPGNLHRGQKGNRATLRAKVYAPAPKGAVTLIRFYERDDQQESR